MFVTVASDQLSTLLCISFTPCALVSFLLLWQIAWSQELKRRKGLFCPRISELQSTVAWLHCFGLVAAQNTMVGWYGIGNLAGHGLAWDTFFHCWSTTLPELWACGNSPVSASSLLSGMLRVQRHATVPGFTWVLRDLKSGLHAHMPSTLPTEPSF